MRGYCTDLTDAENWFTCGFEGYFDSLSIDLTWLEPLPKEELKLLPNFEDFQCIGRLGCGRYAKVFYVKYIPSQEYLAIKLANYTSTTTI